MNSDTTTLRPTAEVVGVTLHLGTPTPPSRAGSARTRSSASSWPAGWSSIPRDRPLSPRLLGPPGIGKTTLAMAAARLRKQPLYINQCTADTRPEDLLVTPVLAESGKIAYHASPLVSAMLTGGVCVLDEGNRMNEKSWASLAPLLDHRRYVESVVAGITIPAHPDFRVLRDDERGRIDLRGPRLHPLAPPADADARLPRPRRRDGDPQVPPAVRPGGAAGPDRRVPPEGPRAEARLLAARRHQPAALRASSAWPRTPSTRSASDDAWREALLCVLGEEAADLEELARRKRRALGGQHAPMGLGDLFFDPDDPLHPDRRR